MQDQYTHTDEEARKGTSPTGKPSSKYFNIALVVLLIALAAAAFWWVDGAQREGGSDVTAAGSDGAAVVATINGAKVTRATFNESVAQVEQTAVQQGFDPNDQAVRQQIEQQALAILINTTLLNQAAVAAGITASDEQIDGEIAAIEQQFGGAEGLKEQIDALGISIEELRNNISERLVLDTYLGQTDAFSTLEVTDEEARAFYDSIAAQGQEPPPFEDVVAQIREQLAAQKQQEATIAVIEQLRADAEVEINI